MLNIFNFDGDLRIDTKSDIYKKFCEIIRLVDKEKKADWRIVSQTRPLTHKHDSGVAVCMYADFHINGATAEVNEQNVDYFKKYILLSLSYEQLILYVD